MMRRESKPGAWRRGKPRLLLMALIASVLAPAGALAQSPQEATALEEPCLVCHGSPDLSMTLPSGEALSVYIDEEAFATSIHGGKLICSDCHQGYLVRPHPRRRTETRREYTLAHYEVCKTCHFANYTKTLDSMHFDVLSVGRLEAPVCTDCHGAHYVTAPDKPRGIISQTCSQCHASIYQTYASSIHGKALIEEENPDVPVCTDCHGAHNITDPRTASFRLETPDLCARCHTDQKLMDKYSLSTAVLDTYLADFHGTTIALEREESSPGYSAEAVCTDCHGVHDIAKVDDPNSPVLKANLVNTCRRCHPDATENFPGAWLSHYEPSLKKAPLVYLVKLFYSIFIPFVVGGLALHVLLDLWRALTRR